MPFTTQSPPPPVPPRPAVPPAPALPAPPPSGRCNVELHPAANAPTSSARICPRTRRFYAIAGSVNQKVLPRPGVLSTPIAPPIVSTRCLTIERPSPVPPMSRERPLSTR